MKSIFGQWINQHTRLTHLASPCWHWLLPHWCWCSLYPHSLRNKNHFEDLQLCNGKNVTGIARGLGIAGEGTFGWMYKLMMESLTPLRSHKVSVFLAKKYHSFPLSTGLKLPRTIHLWNLKQKSQMRSFTHCCGNSKQERKESSTIQFWTAPGALQYPAFEATSMECDASHLQNHISMDLNRLQGIIKLDPAEFAAD